MLGTLKRIMIGRQPIAPERLELLRRMPRHSVCAEIGVYQGRFSGAILQVSEPRRLHLVDPWRFHPDPTYSKSWFGGQIGQSQAAMDRLHREVQRRFRDQIEAGTVTIHRSFSAEAATNFPDGYFDWVYIDANHMYEFVKQDLHAFYPKVKEGGFLTGDNYGDRPDWWWKDGVKVAVEEFAREGWSDRPTILGDQFYVRKGRAGSAGGFATQEQKSGKIA